MGHYRNQITTQNIGSKHGVKMTDSSSFSSLLALVDSHLSKTSIQGSRSVDANNVARIPIPSLSQPGTLSDTRLALPPGQRLPIPFFNLSESPIQSVLAEQVANMLKAKELKKKQEEEKQRLAEEMKKLKLEEDNCVIDLMKALQTPWGPGPTPKEPSISSSSSFESLFEPKFIDCDSFIEETKTPEPELPCKTDMSYILYQKVRRGKCSAFGRVITSKVRPVAAPYLKEKFQSTIVPFDFSTPSPCDILKEKQRRKTTYSQLYQPDIYNFI